MQSRAEALSRSLGLPLVSRPEEAVLLLRLTPERLELLKPNDPDLRGPVWAEFVHVPRYRQPRKELLIRAMGKKSSGQFVVDATGGLGRDAFLLATAGYRVLVFERHPVVAALLADGLKRACLHPSTAAICKRITLIADDFCKYHTPCTRADIIYLDPMFPAKRKKSRPRKELQLLQLLITEPVQEKLLLQRAMEEAQYRTVVKRPIKGPSLADRSPSLSLRGTAIRFDIYLADTANTKDM